MSRCATYPKLNTVYKLNQKSHHFILKHTGRTATKHTVLHLNGHHEILQKSTEGLRGDGLGLGHLAQPFVAQNPRLVVGIQQLLGLDVAPNLLEGGLAAQSFRFTDGGQGFQQSLRRHADFPLLAAFVGGCGSGIG